MRSYHIRNCCWLWQYNYMFVMLTQSSDLTDVDFSNWFSQEYCILYSRYCQKKFFGSGRNKLCLCHSSCDLFFLFFFVVNSEYCFLQNEFVMKNVVKISTQTVDLLLWDYVLPSIDHSKMAVDAIDVDRADTCIRHLCISTVYLWLVSTVHEY